MSQVETHPPFWRTATFGWSILAGLGVWAAFPPISASALAWLAPIGWIRLIRRPKLDGRFPYRTLLFSCYLHWLLMTQWVRLPHPSAGVGWFFLAAYLTAYLFGFIVLARFLVHRANFSCVIAAPLAWVSMEMARGYLFTGFSMALLGHSQVAQTSLIQIASVTGAYGVSFLIMLLSAAIEDAVWPQESSKRLARRFWTVGLVTALLITVVFLGRHMLGSRAAPTGPSARVAIIQGDLDTEFGDNTERVAQAFDDYVRMTIQATEAQDIDLVVWPESMWQHGIIEYDESAGNERPQPNLLTWEESALRAQLASSSLVRRFGTHCLLGTQTIKWAGNLERYNTAAWYDSSGRRQGVYHKMHPVMFGEYIPLGGIFPWLYELTPMRGVGGLTPGKTPRAFEVAGVGFVPNICFENMVPNLIRNQLRTLDQQGQRTDVLVTLTNDGWFWGSSLLDLHLACGMFRAVESRRPLLIAANTGFSAHIDSTGQLVAQGPRRQRQVLIADVHGSESSLSFYTRYGDCFGWLCGAICAIGLAVGGLRSTTRTV